MSPTLICNENGLYLLGGYNSSQQAVEFNPDVYFSNFNNLEWKRLDISLGSAARSAGAILVNEEITILPGYNYTSSVNLITRINLTSEEILNLEVPFIATSYASTSVSASLYLFGGNIDDMTYTNQLTLFSSKTQIFSLISSDFTGPSSRKYHSFLSINANLYLFGGFDGTSHLNDLWMFMIPDETWQKIEPNGLVPSARSCTAVASEGDHMFIFGGSDSGMLNDLYSYSIRTNVWTPLGLDSAVLPSARTGACAVYFGAGIYLYGGMDLRGLLSEMWIYDLKMNQYLQLSSSPSIFRENSCYLDGSVIYVISSNSTEKAVFAYDIPCDTWNEVYTWDTHSMGSADILIPGYIISLGGILYQNIPKNSLDIYDIITGQKTCTYLLGFNIYQASVAYFQTSLYLFGGSADLGNMIASQTFTSNLMKIDVSQFLLNTNICSKGTYYWNSSCNMCEEGSYANTSGLGACYACPLGTYSKQAASTSLQGCYDCPVNSWNNSTGSFMCMDCPINKYCPYGSINPALAFVGNSYNSIQPQGFVQDLSNYNFALLLSTYLISILAFSGIILMVVSKRLRENLFHADMYTTKHNHKLMVPMYIKKTTLGGLCTLVFMMGALVFITLTMLKYYMVNTIETRTLVPLITVVDPTVQSSINFVLSFNYYGGSCGNEGTCSDAIYITYLNIQGVITSGCLQEQSACVINIACLECAVQTGAEIDVTFLEDNSFCSEISVNITADSSIPGEISSIQGVISSGLGMLFTGTEATVFAFTLIPTLFEGAGNDSKGYHISMSNSPSPGTLKEFVDFRFSSRLGLQLSLGISDTCLIISRGSSTSLLELFSALIGTVFGIMSSVGGILNVSEKHYDNFVSWIDHRDMLKYYRARIRRLLRNLYYEKKNIISRDTTMDNANFSEYPFKEPTELDLTNLPK